MLGQCVRVGCSSSSLCRVVSGVPQGSVLEPVLFILFVNNIVYYVADNISVKLFADDAILGRSLATYAFTY